MQKNSTTEKVRVPHHALASGQAFQKLAEVFIYKIPDIEEDPVLPDNTDEISDLIACATNLALALELYMKAFLSQLDLQIPQTHDLYKLYDLIPKPVASDIELRYLACIKIHSPLWRSTSFTLATGPIKKPQWDDSKKNSIALPKLLDRSKNLFQSWRYAFEFTHAADNPYQFRTFEYAWLWCAAEAIKAEFISRFCSSEEIASLPKYMR